MELILYLIIGLIIFVANNSSNKTKTATIDNTQGINELFNEVMAQAYAKNSETSRKRNNSSGTRKSGTANKSNSSRNKKHDNKASSLTTPSSHDHNCDDVNYDEMDSLMGRNEVFDLSGTIGNEQDYRPLNQSGFKMTKNDLLRSFVMSEVLQRYDINRIYSRIPNAKSDD